MKIIANSNQIKLFSQLSRGLIGVLLVAVPFHAFLTVWASSITGGYTAWRLWPELLLLGISLLAVIELARNPKRLSQLKTDKLFVALLCYIVVIFTWGIIGLVLGNLNWSALAQGWITDARLPVSFLAAWILAPHFARPTRQLWRWLIAPAILVVLFGWLQAVALPADFLKHFGYSPQTISATETVDQKDSYIRVQSTLRGANPLGAYLVIVISLCLIGAVSYRRYWLVFSGVGLLSLLVLYFTYSRSAYIGAIVAVLMTIWYSIKQVRWRRRIIWSAAILLVLMSSLVFIFRDNNQLQNVLFHTDETSTASQSSNAQRGAALKAGAEDVLSNPLGEGVGTAGPASANNKVPGRIAENYFLQIGQEMGWLGLSCFVIIYGLIAHRLWLNKSRPMALALLASLVGLTLVNMLSHAWSDETLAFVWWLSAGLFLGSDIINSESKHKNDKKVYKTART